MSAYYNEFDPEKAAWIRELIKAGVVAPGEVDERSITEVRADDLRGFKQCHFFAGIAVWSYALRLAGWPDSRPCWTGSCPCPSFSCAGKGEGFDDPRHLWPHWYPLISECRPGTIFGEQADAAIGFGWLDLVSGDLEAQGYAVAAAVLGAHSVGAPHIRQRLYFVGHSEHSASDRLSHGHGIQGETRLGSNSEHDGRNRSRRIETIADSNQPEVGILDGNRTTRGSSDADGGQSSDRGIQRSGEQRLQPEDCGTGKREHPSQERSQIRPRVHGEHDRMQPADGCTIGDGRHAAERGFAMHGSAPGNGRHASLTDQTGIGSQPEREGLQGFTGDVREWRGPGWLDPHTARSIAQTGATRGFWRDCDWWYARDGKYRPIESGLFPLVNGASNRVLKLRGYGDAIVPEVAAAFIEAYQHHG